MQVEDFFLYHTLRLSRCETPLVLILDSERDLRMVEMNTWIKVWNSGHGLAG